MGEQVGWKNSQQAKIERIKGIFAGRSFLIDGKTQKMYPLASYVYMKGWVKHRGGTFQCNIITQAFVPSDLFSSPWAV